MWHFNLVSDPAKHSYKETLVSLLWCWEVRRCMHCPWQLLVPGKVITPHEVTDMSEHLQHCAARQKLERVASFRQLQGYSNQLRVMTSGRDTLCGSALGQLHIITPSVRGGSATVWSQWCTEPCPLAEGGWQRLCCATLAC